MFVRERSRASTRSQIIIAGDLSLPRCAQCHSSPIISAIRRSSAGSTNTRPAAKLGTHQGTDLQRLEDRVVPAVTASTSAPRFDRCDERGRRHRGPQRRQHSSVFVTPNGGSTTDTSAILSNLTGGIRATGSRLDCRADADFRQLAGVGNQPADPRRPDQYVHRVAHRQHRLHQDGGCRQQHDRRRHRRQRGRHSIQRLRAMTDSTLASGFGILVNNIRRKQTPCSPWRPERQPAPSAARSLRQARAPRRSPDHDHRNGHVRSEWPHTYGRQAAHHPRRRDRADGRWHRHPDGDDRGHHRRRRHIRNQRTVAGGTASFLRLQSSAAPEPWRTFSGSRDDHDQQPRTP